MFAEITTLRTPTQQPTAIEDGQKWRWKYGDISFVIVSIGFGSVQVRYEDGGLGFVDTGMLQKSYRLVPWR